MSEQRASARTSKSAPVREGIVLRHEDEVRASRAAILLHGLTGAPSEMILLGETLFNRSFDVFIPALSGHGSIEELRRTRSSEWKSDVDRCLEDPAVAHYAELHIAGQSFGALLALYAALRFPKRIASLALLSVPLRFRSQTREILLGALSRLPDEALDRLGVVKKPEPPASIFARERECFDCHSIGASARLVSLRRELLPRLHEVRQPVLLLQDPHDHHVSASVPRLLRQELARTLTTSWIPGGHHELTLGPSHALVGSLIAEFFDSAVGGHARSEYA